MYFLISPLGLSGASHRNKIEVCVRDIFWNRDTVPGPVEKYIVHVLLFIMTITTDILTLLLVYGI